MKRIRSIPPSLHRNARQLKRLGRLVVGNDAIYRYDRKPQKILLGTVYGGWMIAPASLDANSIMFSFGVGNDISFDLEAIRKFEMTVHGFDPSPEAVRWISGRTDLPSRYVFRPYGLGPKDGEVDFYTPVAGGMYSLNEAHQHVGESKISLPVKSLRSIFGALNTRYVDILKWISKAQNMPKSMQLSTTVCRLGSF